MADVHLAGWPGAGGVTAVRSGGVMNPAAAGTALYEATKVLLETIKVDGGDMSVKEARELFSQVREVEAMLAYVRDRLTPSEPEFRLGSWDHG